MMKDLKAMMAKADAMEHFPVNSNFYKDDGSYAPGAKESLPKVMRAVAAYLSPNGVAADMGIEPYSEVHTILFGTHEERIKVADVIRTCVMQMSLMDNEDVLHAVRDWVEAGQIQNVRSLWNKIDEIVGIKRGDKVQEAEVWCLINSVVLIERIKEEELNSNTRMMIMTLEANGCMDWIASGEDCVLDMRNVYHWSINKLYEFTERGSLMDNEWSCAMNMISIGDCAMRIANMEGIDIGGKSLIMGGAEINSQPRTEVEWLVDGMIPKTTNKESPYIGFLYGNSSTYKSFIATGICSAVVKGCEYNPSGFAGLASVGGETGKVMYLSGEDSIGVRVRFEAEFGGLVPEGVKMNINEMDTIYGKDDELDFKIMMCIEDFAPDLVVLDTMNSLKLCENNNSSAAVSKMMHKLKSLGATVMIVHHSTKGGDSMEGSHAMFSNADFVLRTDVVDREDDIPVVDLSCGKLKNSIKFKPMRIELVDQGDSLVCRNHEQYEDSRVKNAIKLGIDESLVRVIQESGEEGMTLNQIFANEDIKSIYESDKGSLQKFINRKIDGKIKLWSGIVKIDSEGREKKYVFEG